MGADLRTFAVRGADRQEVRDLVVRWLGAKGFEPSDDRSLFPFDPGSERDVVLCETPGWTIVTFSHGFEEGDRLIFELNKLRKPLLEVWVHDSDIWGYRLHDSSELVASFNSNPRYFGGPAELELPRNGDPELLCEVCNLSIKPGRIASIQRQRAIFSEGLAERFCAEIGVEPAAYDYREFEELRLDPGQYTTAGGIKIDRMLFARREVSGRQSARSLHEVVLRAPRVPRVDPQMAVWQAEMQATLFPLMIVLRVVGWGFRAVFWLLRPFFYLWLRRRIATSMRSRGLLQELQALEPSPEVERRGRRLMNRRHGCSFELPASGESMADFGPRAVFHFRIGSVYVHCDALRPSQLREQLKIWPGVEILEDEEHFIGDLPARSVLLEHTLLQHTSADQTQRIVWHLVETHQAVYRFQATGETLSDEVRQQVRAAFESFRLEQPPA